MSRETENQVNLSSLYQDIILEHQKEPRSYGNMPQANRSAEGYNPMCGDRIQVQLKLDASGKKLIDQRFCGHACSICMASASMMMEEVEGSEVSSVLKKVQDFRDMMQGKACRAKFEGDIEALSGVKKFPVRIKCALLPWITLKDAIEKSSRSETKNE